MPTVEPARSVTVDLDQRKITRAHTLHQAPPEDPESIPVTVTSRAADTAATPGVTPQIQVAIAGQIFNALLNPSLYGWPDATNTGIAGVGLTDDDLIEVGTIRIFNANVTEDGIVVATRPGSGSTTWGPITLYPTRTDIIEGHVFGRMRQDSAYEVRLLRSKVTHDATNLGSTTVDASGKLNWTTASLLVEDCTIWGGTKEYALAGGLWTARRCDISGGKDNVRLQSASYIYDSYLHDCVRVPGSHNDSFQAVVGGGLIVQHCTMLVAKPAAPFEAGAMQFPDGWYWPMNAAWQAGAATGAGIADTLIDDCLMDGGNYTISVNNTGQPILNQVITNNRFGRHFRYGHRLPATVQSEWTWTNNVWDDTGAPAN